MATGEMIIPFSHIQEPSLKKGRVPTRRDPPYLAFHLRLVGHVTRCAPFFERGGTSR
jgi:hypothetical protein